MSLHYWDQQAEAKGREQPATRPDSLVLSAERLSANREEVEKKDLVGGSEEEVRKTLANDAPSESESNGWLRGRFPLDYDTITTYERRLAKSRVR